MSAYPFLYELNATGLDAFEKVFTGQIDDSAIDPVDPALASRVQGTKPFAPGEFLTAKAMAEAVVASLGTANLFDLLPNTGMWAWLTFVMRDQLFRKTGDGTWKVGEIHRWFPSDPNDYQKAQRHLVRMPVTLLETFGHDADHLLCGEVSVHGQVRESLTSQQNMFNKSFQKAARLLYFDVATGKNKVGASSKTRGGSVRRLASVKRQLDVTWDLEDLDPMKIIETLPAEFSHFKPEPSS